MISPLSRLTANYARQEVVIEGIFHPTDIIHLKRGDGLRWFRPKLPVSILTILVAQGTLLKGAWAFLFSYSFSYQCTITESFWGL